MHPAKSVIFFTTASGAGYGLMIWLGLLAFLGLVPPDWLFGLVAFGIGFTLIVSGLLSSTLHLGRPERAWRALSQWRSSWLSREGVAAIATFGPLGIFALCWVFLENNSGLVAVVGLIGALMSALTVFTTSMIYASLKAIPAWHNSWTVPGYMILGPMNGALIALVLLALFGHAEAKAFVTVVALGLLVVGALIKVIYWRGIHTRPPTSTAGTATGLGHLGKVDLSASPHDTDNYLLREMGFRIARKHANKLRWIALILAFVLPVVLLVLSIQFVAPLTSLALLMLAWAGCQIGVTVERWLFFAEAKHVVTLYYGEHAV